MVSSSAGQRTTKVSSTTAAAKKAAPVKAAPAKAPARTAPAKATAAKAPAKKAPAKKAAPAAKAPARTAAPAAKAPTTKAATPAAKAAPARKASPAKKSVPAVRVDETPWTAKELRDIRKEIQDDMARLQAEIAQAEAELVGLMRDSGDGAGDDQADAGAKTYEREQEMTVANNAREMHQQYAHALERLDDGTYGRCESCGNPIGKLRLQAAPRATLCLECKKKEERR